MSINFGSVISNTKGAANIAKLKVNLGLKTNELNKAYAELGKLFYECTKNNPIKDAETVSDGTLSVETENMNSLHIDYMSDEKMCDCLKKIPGLEEEIATLESQMLNEKGNMQPIDIPKGPMSSGNNQSYYSQDPVVSTETGMKCPKCGRTQSADNEFCVYCGIKISE